MNSKLIKRLKEIEGINGNGTIYSELVKEGFIPLSINCALEMYEYFSVRMIVNGEFSDCKSRSYSDAADKFKVSDRTIQRAVKFFNK